MIIGIDKGHTVVNGGCPGASDLLNESRENREVGNRLIAKLKALGHTVVDCSCNYSNSSDLQLTSVTREANKQHLDLFLSLHLNAGGGTGAEIFTTNPSGAYEKADNLINIYCNETGFKNRGHKIANYYVLRRTQAPAMLIELAFVDNKADYQRWNNLSYDLIVDAIVKGLTGEVSANTSKPNPEAKPQHNNKSNWIARLQQECNVQGFSHQVVDGIPGHNTINGCPTVREGARGNITKLLQEKLNSRGYNTNGVDGIFGFSTTKAVIQFQKRYGLDQDGIVGKGTWSKLIYC